MPAPTFYTEQSLKEFMLIELGSIGESLGWDAVPLRVDAAVHDVEALLGVADVVDVTDLSALRLLARLCIWRAARGALASAYGFSTEGQAFERQQQWEHADRMVIDAELQAASLGGVGAGVIAVETIQRPDPYVDVAVVADWAL